MPGCNECKNYHSEIKFFENESTQTCTIGNNCQMKQWWVENGHKYSSKGDVLTDMVCFEETEFTKMMKDMMSKLEELQILIRQDIDRKNNLENK